MYQVTLDLQNRMIFGEFSSRYPKLKIYRWCSSVFDYLEMYGETDEIHDAMIFLGEVANDLHTELTGQTVTGNRATAMMNCRCTVDNSAIRIIESRNFIWQAPASYHGGIETIKLVAFDQGSLSELSEVLGTLGEVTLTSKRKVVPETLRDIYTVALSEITGVLTDKQVRYLTDAISLGFFESPRRIKLEDLAKMHGVSKSTMQEHINKAKNKLILSLEPYLNLSSPGNDRKTPGPRS